MSYTYQLIDFDNVKSVKFNGNDVESIKFNGTKIWEKQTTPIFDSTFGNNSWATISEISQIISSQNMNSSQIYTTYGWQVGDKKSITLSTNEVIEVQIIGFNHDTLSSDHTSKAGITLQMVNCLATPYTMNDTDTNAGGYAASKMKTETLPALKLLLPQECQDVIKLVDKKSANGGASNYSETITTSENLFLLASIEILGSDDSSYDYAQDGSNEGTQYLYWAAHNTAYDRTKYYVDNAGTQTKTSWWERSSYYKYVNNFCIMSLNGSKTSIPASYYNTRVAFGFCV